MPCDLTQSLQQAVQAAAATKTPLQIIAGGSKAFYGHRLKNDQPLNVAQNQGIIAYEPSELVITARAGTPLREIAKVLAEKGQWLAFEPPAFGETATFGGTMACGFSGPARPYLGAARDFVLGVKCLNGKGELLEFGGQVMKNVAGYDVSRLMVGALGTLGVLLEISCKVLPLPQEEVTLVKEVSTKEALKQMIYWGNQAVPLTASCFDGEKLVLRLAGTCIGSAHAKIGGEVWEQGKQFWENLREHRLPFFAGEQPPLWRLSVPPKTTIALSSNELLIEWGGGLRWLRTDLSPAIIRKEVEKIGGHATLFRGGDRTGAIFHPLPTALDNLQRRLKQQFDPHQILNHLANY
jgi:glycolate oxidase FAD binding subunit